MHVARVTSTRRKLGPGFLAVLVAVIVQVVVFGSVTTSATAVESRPIRLTPAALDALTIPEIQDLMAERELTSVHLTLAYLDRTRDVDDEVNAVLTVNPRAVAEAAASDNHRRRHGPRSALEGVPVLLKDNIDTASRLLPTTAGSNALLRSRPADDAWLVQRLRAAGAVIVGKANLSEWANFRSFLSTSGWSAVGGLTNNPYVLDRNACGSSSGSGAGVAAPLAQVAIGTETDGSIVCPAGATGVVGHKPTLGLVSRSGIVPISAQQDTAGPMARHVIDAALTLAVVQGADPEDPATSLIPPDHPTEYTLDPDALVGARIGVWRLETGSPETDAITDQAVAALENAGAATVDLEVLPNQDIVGENEFPALLAEFKRDINAYLAATPGDHPADLAGLIAFNDPAYLAQRAAATGGAQAGIDETLADEEVLSIAHAFEQATQVRVIPELLPTIGP